MKHRLSLFRSAHDNVPKLVSYTWPEFVEALLPHEFRPIVTTSKAAKLECDAFSPAIYPPGLTRADDNVIAFSVYAADLDHVTDEDVERFITLALARGWAFVVYSTWRHDIDPNRLRAVFPLSREVTPDEWPHLWQALFEALGGLSDPTCGNLSRLYFGAFAPDTEEARAAVVSHVFDGSPVDVDKLLGTPPDGATRASQGQSSPSDGNAHHTQETVSRDQLERFARALIRKRDERAQEHGHTLRKVVNGEAFAESGNRDNAIFQISLVLAERFADADPSSIAAHFDRSLGLMTEPDEITTQDVAYKISRAQQSIHDARHAAEDDADQRHRRMIRDAFGSDRETPYTPDELAAMPDRRWIIQKGRSYYTLVADAYRGPYTQDEAQSAAMRDLSPALSAGVELYTISPQGTRAPKSLGQLVRSYGFVANDISASLVAQRSYFNEPTRTLVEAPSPLRELTPVYHAEIDAWLEALAGPEKIHLLKAWIAAVTLLDRPCTALFLTGHKSTGKSLLPEGLSRLWTALGFPTPLEDVLGVSFNDAQLRCPLVFADERLPTDHRGRVLNAELRHYIQARRRPLRRKFLSNADMIGAVRLIISANNEEILATSENLSNYDIGAIVDRYLHIVCRVEAFHYLQDVDSTKWVDGDMIAEHALHLRDAYEWKPNGRFLVHGDDAELHSRLISSSGVRSAVLQFCVGYMLDPGPLDANARAQYWIQVSQGRLCVNVQALLAGWSTYVGNENCPTTGRLSSAIAALATDERPRLSIPGKGRPNFRVIERDHLIAWGEQNGFASREQIEEALLIDTEEQSKHLAPN